MICKNAFGAMHTLKTYCILRPGNMMLVHGSIWIEHRCDCVSCLSTCNSPCCWMFLVAPNTNKHYEHVTKFGRIRKPSTNMSFDTNYILYIYIIIFIYIIYRPMVGFFLKTLNGFHFLTNVFFVWSTLRRVPWFWRLRWWLIRRMEKFWWAPSPSVRWSPP